MTTETTSVRSVAVFCGSRRHTIFSPLAEALGRQLALGGVAIAYGGGGSGLMGAVARGAISVAGRVTGIVPHDLFGDEQASAPKGVEPFVTSGGGPGMHQRKHHMYRLADAFIVLPGGLGTMDECWESATWTQLGLHDHRRQKQVILLNWKGHTGLPFYTHLARHLEHTVAEGLLTSAERETTIHVADTTDDALKQLGISLPDSRHAAGRANGSPAQPG